MSWEAWAAIGQLLSALLVLVSLVYLALQVRLYTRTARADSETEFQMYWNSHITGQWNGDEAKSNIFRRGLADLNNLTPDERVLFHGFLGDMIDAQRIAKRLHTNKQMHDDLFEAVNISVASVVKSPGALAWWNETKFYYIHRDAIDALIARDDTPASEVPTFSFSVNESLTNLNNLPAGQQPTT